MSVRARLSEKITRDDATYTRMALAGSIWFFGAATASFAARACPSLESSSHEARLEYLKGERARLDSGCVLYAMEALGAKEYQPAVSTLIRYLDYRDPKKMSGFQPVHIEWSGSIYPAGGALFQIGRPAVASLLKAIADAATPDLIRHNAADVVLAIYRGDLVEGVAVLVRAARVQEDFSAYLRVIDEARREAARCGNDLRDACENAIVREDHR